MTNIEIVVKEGTTADVQYGKFTKSYENMPSLNNPDSLNMEELAMYEINERIINSLALRKVNRFEDIQKNLSNAPWLTIICDSDALKVFWDYNLICTIIFKEFKVNIEYELWYIDFFNMELEMSKKKSNWRKELISEEDG